MKIGNLVKFIDFTDPHYDKVGVVLHGLAVGRAGSRSRNKREDMAISATLGVGQVRCLIQLLFLLSVLQ